MVLHLWSFRSHHVLFRICLVTCYHSFPDPGVIFPILVTLFLTSRRSTLVSVHRLEDVYYLTRNFTNVAIWGQEMVFFLTLSSFRPLHRLYPHYTPGVCCFSGRGF